MVSPVQPKKPIRARYQSRQIGKIFSIINIICRRLIRLIGQEQLLRQRTVYTPLAHRFERVMFSETQKERVSKLYTEACDKLIPLDGKG
jgi:hypothetical protein